MVKAFGLEIGGKKKPKQIIQQDTSKGAAKSTIEGFVPRSPGVNIISPEILETYEAVRLRNKFTIIAAALAFVVVAGFFGKFIVANGDESELVALDATGTSLTAQMTSLNAYETYIKTIDSKRSGLVAQLSGDIDYATIVSNFRNSADKAGVTITSITIASSAPSAADVAAGTAATESSACPSPDPFTPSNSIGCITFTGYSQDQGQAAVFTTELSTIPSFVNAYIPSVTVSEDKVDFDGSVAFGADMYNQRFFGLSEPLQAKLQSGSTTTDPTAVTDPTATIEGN